GDGVVDERRLVEHHGDADVVTELVGDVGGALLNLFGDFDGVAVGGLGDQDAEARFAVGPGDAGGFVEHQFNVGDLGELHGFRGPGSRHAGDRCCGCAAGRQPDVLHVLERLQPAAGGDGERAVVFSDLPTG